MAATSALQVIPSPSSKWKSALPCLTSLISSSCSSSAAGPLGVPLQKRKRQDSNVHEDTPVPKSIRLDGPGIRTILNDTYGYEFVQQAAYTQKTGNGPSGLQALFSHHSLTLLFRILGCESFGCVETLSTSWERVEVQLGDSIVSAGEIAQALGWKTNTLDNRRVFMNKAFTLFGLPWKGDLPAREYNLSMTFSMCNHIKLFIGIGKDLSIEYDYLQHYLRLTMIRYVPPVPNAAGGPSSAAIRIGPRDIAARTLTIEWLREWVPKFWDARPS